jgi:hypothetical protein
LTVFADMRQTSLAKAKTLNSWKEIATYLGRGVRTVQRWESELRLPVHRMGKSDRSPVFAFRAEVDGWLRTQAGSQPHAPEAGTNSERFDRVCILDRSSRLTSTTLQLIEKQRAQTLLIAEQVNRMADLLPAANKSGLLPATARQRRS